MATNSSPTTFRDMIAKNKRNSIALIVLFCLFTAVVVMVFVAAILGLAEPELLSTIRWEQAVVFGLLAAGFSLVLSIAGLFSGDQLVLGVSHARPIVHDDDPELFNVVEETAIAAGLPMPRVYLIDDSAPNAFATGRDPRHASIAITSGLRAKLTRNELQGVIAHEMSHIRNYDIRLMLLMAVLIGTIAMLADFLWQMLRFSSWRGRGRRSRDGESGGAIVLIVVVVAVVLGLVAPVLARIIQFAVSREREYLADSSAVELTRNPYGLASALRKIDANPEVLEVANQGTAHLYIANPIKRFEERANSIFASHPPIQDRINRLEALTV